MSFGKSILAGALCIPVLLLSFVFEVEALALEPSGGTDKYLGPTAARSNGSVSGKMLMGAAVVGERIVAVGDHGLVVLSDDSGVQYRQAASVPVDVLLNSVAFSDKLNGWAVGHRGTIIHTEDGGESWALQRYDLSVDQPLFSVYFKSPSRGWAVGLWSLFLETRDGGKTWKKVETLKPPGDSRLDRNLFSVFGDQSGNIYVVGEQGFAARSSDEGDSWSFLNTGYNGSLWTGAVLANGAILVGGLRGTMLRSDDSGLTWQRIPTDRFSSITGIAVARENVYAAALDGVSLSSSDSGRTFVASQRSDRVALTAVVVSKESIPLVFSKSGVLRWGEK